MEMDCYDGTESCGSRAAVECYSSSSSRSRRQREKADEILWRLRELGVEEASRYGFDAELSAHFARLPYRYALDMSVEKAQDVLMHKKLLHMARDPATRPAIDVRPVQPSSFEQNGGNSVHSDTSSRLDAHGTGPTSRLSVHPAPDLWPNLNTSEAPGSHVSDSSTHSDSLYSGTMYEITISTNDKRKFLSQLTHLMSGLGLNIHEAHAFSTEDGYSLDIFVVACLEEHGADELKATLVKELLKTERSLPSRNHVADANKKEKSGLKLMPKQANVSNGEDLWEIDASLLMFKEKLTSGSFGDLFRGTYLGQDVAIKVFQSEHINKALRQEFTQEILILRKIQHRNIVKFIGASKRPPHLCIVTEYMPGGSVFDFLRKQKDVLELPVILRIANDVAKGMNYLHHNKIIHRDLKAANLLMDENNAVKIADFGVAKIQTQPGVMTAETGTYRWMAPEVIEHKPYNHKADVFSFGVVLWELITGKLPYEELTPLQAAIGVVQKGLRPTIPSHTHPELEKLLNRCWQRDPSTRPDFSEIVEILNHISNTAKS